MPTSDYTPTLDEIAALLRTRTVDTTGTETGTFSAATRPTNIQVAALAETAADDVSTDIGTDIPSTMFNRAKNAVIYKTGMLVELSYFPEQIGTNRSPYAQYKDLYDENITKVAEAVAAQEAAAGTEDTTQSPGLARFSFPPDQGGMIGWGTKW